jgi:hypothetical protein
MLTRELIAYCLGEDTERNGYCAKNIYFNLALPGCSDELLSFYLYCQEGIDAINSLERTVYNLETFEMFSTKPDNNECFAAFDKVFELTSKFYAEKSLGGVSTAPMHFAENLTQTYRNAMIDLGYGSLLNPAIQISVFNPYGSLDYFEASKIMSDLFKSIQIAILRRLSDDANTELIGALSDAIDADSAKG